MRGGAKVKMGVPWGTLYTCGPEGHGGAGQSDGWDGMTRNDSEARGHAELLIM